MGFRDAGFVTVGISISGISPVHSELIFRKFERISLLRPMTGTPPPVSPLIGSDSASEEPSEEPSGVGLSLAIVTRIVCALGGQLRVASRVGEGSRFTLILPLALDD
ncbi:hypothetical protein RQP46_010101 [Phenoliferia psychrophenolica]